MKKILFILIILIAYTSNAQIVDIPDANFKNALVNTLCVDTNGDGTFNADADTNDDGEIQVSEAEAVLRLNVDENIISSLDGIQSFVNIILLSCHINELTSIDVFQNPNLEHLRVSGNDLESIDVTQNPNLINLSFEINGVVTIDVSQNPFLEILSCGNNLIESLDVSQNPNLKSLLFPFNRITTLNVANNLYLESLWCTGNFIETLDVSHISTFRSLRGNSNDLISLNIKNGNNHNMTVMQVEGNPNLACIMIDDENASRPECYPYSGWCKDSTTVYRENCNLDVEDLDAKNGITLYPNPTGDVLNIQSKIPVENVLIYSVHGVLVKEVIENNIDVSNLSPGLYFATISIDRKDISKKFIKI